MDPRERLNDPEETLRVAMDGRQRSIWTALPGIVESFDPTKMTVSVQPALMGKRRKQDKTVVDEALPILPDVPVLFPGGGGCHLTFPVTVGDECVVVFSSRCIDGWWDLGGVQSLYEVRMHDLSDGFAIVGVMSRPRAFAVDTTQVQLRSDDGEVSLSLDPDTHAAILVAPGDATVTAPVVTINGELRVTGNITAGYGGDDEITVQGHTHGGVQSGGAQTAQPTPGT